MDIFDIGERLMLERKRSRKTLDEISKGARVSQPTVSALEYGRGATLTSLFKVLDYYNLEIILQKRGETWEDSNEKAPEPSADT